MAKAECLQLRQGNCGGCPVLPIVADRFRWKSIPPETAAKEVAKHYCPDGLVPQTRYILNTDACYTMGQQRRENTAFDAVDRREAGKKPYRK